MFIMDSFDYMTKTLDCLDSIGALLDPSYNGNVRSTINAIKHLLDKEPLREAVLVSNPRLLALTVASILTIFFIYLMFILLR